MVRKPTPASKSSLTLHYQVEAGDIIAFHDYHLWRHTRRAPLALGLIVVVGTVATLTTSSGDPFTNALLAGVVPAIAFFWTIAHSRRKMVRLARERAILGGHTLEVSSRGFRQVRADGVETRRKWSEPLQIIETPSHIFVYVNATQAVIIPQEALSSSEERGRFLALLREGAKSGG